MKGIQGHFGDNYLHLDSKKKTPNNYAEYLDSCTDVPATEAELEAGIVVVDQARADLETERDGIKLIGRKVRDEGYDSLGPLQKNKLWKHIVRDLLD